MRESVTLTTSDNIRIAGHWYPVAEPRGWALLLHMMPATKESYGNLAEELQRRNVASLAIDFRGHGESQGGPKGYERFSDVEQQAKINDVLAAMTWIEDSAEKSATLPKGYGEHPPANYIKPRTVVVGASIGANLALQLFEEEPGLAGAVLLSPGLDYRGVKADAIARKIRANEARDREQQGRLSSILLAAGGVDDRYSSETVLALANMLEGRVKVKSFGNAGHGTAMFEREPSFLPYVADWVTETIEGPSQP
jgi:alpha-beta hydrolase superfamily lysophospholipase